MTAGLPEVSVDLVESGEALIAVYKNYNAVALFATGRASAHAGRRALTAEPDDDYPGDGSTLDASFRSWLDAGRRYGKWALPAGTEFEVVVRCEFEDRPAQRATFTA